MTDKADEIIEFFEGNKTVVYLDSNGFRTCGVGHLLPHNTTLQAGDSVTPDQVDEWYQQDKTNATARVSRTILIPLQDYELSALISQAFNLTSFEMLANHLQIQGRAVYKQKSLLYCKDEKGKTFNGLLIRRISERLLFDNRYWKDIATSLQAKDSLSYTQSLIPKLFP